MQRITALSAVFVFALAIFAAPAFSKVELSGEVAAGAQAVEGDGNGYTQDLETAFTNPAFNLNVYGDVASGVSAYTEIHSDVGGASDLNVNEAYITLDELLQQADVKVGQFEVAYGNHQMTRSDNADVQDNALVGNHMIDLYSSEAGVELSGSTNQFAWAAAVTNGEASGSQFAQDSELAYSGKVWGDVMPQLSVAGSVYVSDQSDAGSNPGLSNQGSNAYQGINGGVAANPGLQGGNGDVTAYQVDASYEFPQGTVVDGWWGNYEDDASGGGDEWDYYGAEVRHSVNPMTEIAARYELAEEGNTNNNNEANRLQVGANYQVASNTLAKIEYVDQEVEQGIGVGSSASEFDGISGELSVSF